MKKPSTKTGEYRNLSEMEGHPGLWQFEVKVKNGWQLLTNMAAQDDEGRREFAQKTANYWRRKKI